jgi:hypothetical protein
MFEDCSKKRLVRSNEESGVSVDQIVGEAVE